MTAMWSSAAARSWMCPAAESENGMKFLGTSRYSRLGSTCFQLPCRRSARERVCASASLLGDILLARKRSAARLRAEKVMPCWTAAADIIYCARQRHRVNQGISGSQSSRTPTVPAGRRRLVYTHGAAALYARHRRCCVGAMCCCTDNATPMGAVWQGNLYLNPGSVSIPKNDTAHGYMTLENGVFTWKTLSGRSSYHTALHCKG